VILALWQKPKCRNVRYSGRGRVAEGTREPV